MANVLRPYNRAQNNYASGVAETNAKNALAAGAEAGLAIKCQVRVVPVDIFGNVLDKAKVTINEGSGLVEDCANIAEVDQYSEVTYKAELEGYGTVEGSISEIVNDALVEVVLPFDPASVGQ